MAKLTLRTPWTRQPQGPVGINWSNPLTRGLLRAELPTTGLFPTSSGIAGAISKSLTLAESNRAASGGTILTSLTYRAVPAAFTGSIYLGYYVSAANLEEVALTAFNGSGARSATARKNTGTLFNIGRNQPSVGTTVNTAINWNNVGVGTLYEEGQSSLTISDQVTSSFAAGNLRTFAIGGAHVGATYGFLYDRVLTDDERLAIWRNPWQLFAPIQRTLWVPTAAGGGTNTYTLAVSGGFSLGGTAQYNRVRNSQVSAGISFSGSSPLARTRVAQISGGVTFGGSAPITFVPFGGAVYTLAVSGGFSLGGTAPYNRVRVQPVSAGVNFGGAANYQRIRVSQISGGVTFGGTNSIIFIPAGGAINIPQRTIVGAGT